MDTQYTIETITAYYKWTPKLLSFCTSRDSLYHFQAGQFARLGVSDGQKIVWRAYSMVSAPCDKQLEFCSIVIPNGEFTTVLARLDVGDTIYIDKRAFGFLTLERFSHGGELWLMATGTGIAPFLSILCDPEVWNRFEHIVLVCSVREAAELVYQNRLQQLYHHDVFGKMVQHKFRYVNSVTRQSVAGTYRQRITSLLEQSILERDLGLPIVPERSRVMICGNPFMVRDIRKLLQLRGLTMSRLAQPGNMVVEQFWQG